MERKSKDPWFPALKVEDSDRSSSSPFSNRSSSGSSDSGSDTNSENYLSSDIEVLGGSSNDIVSKNNLQQFVHKIDANASLDDQAYDALAKIADAFAGDVAMRMMKMAKLSKTEVNMTDLQFTLKREYNMVFSKKFSNRDKSKKRKNVDEN